jgi:hypothetical protein
MNASGPSAPSEGSLSNESGRQPAVRVALPAARNGSSEQVFEHDSSAGRDTLNRWHFGQGWKVASCWSCLVALEQGDKLCDRQSRYPAYCYSKVLSSALGQCDRYQSTLRRGRDGYRLALLWGTKRESCRAGGGGGNHVAARRSLGAIGVLSFRERRISGDIGFAGRPGEPVRANCIERRLRTILLS